MGDTTPRQMPQPRSLLYSPRFSPDGRWLAYASNRSGVNQVYVRPFPAEGATHVISTGAGDTPVWSRDGRRLYYVANGRINVATISAAPEFTVTARAQFPDGPYDLATPMHAAFDVAPDGQHLLVVKRMTASAQLMVVYGWKYELRARVGQTGRK